MDAPPTKEPIDGFIAIAQQLENIGVHSPHIKAQDIEQGFLLLEDLGNKTYLDELTKGDNVNGLYSDAINALISIQQGRSSHTNTIIPTYSNEKLDEEMNLFTDWYIEKHLSNSLTDEMLSTWEACKETLIQACNEQPQVWVHRDYHCRNLMVVTENSPGVIDFQDMVIGPIAYDLASIFKDCYIQWPREQQLAWLEEYRHKANTTLDIAPITSEQLIRWFDFTGLQRHLKVLGIFCRLYYRDGKKQYLNDLPLVAKYVLETLDRYPELANFKSHFVKSIKHAL